MLYSTLKGVVSQFGTPTPSKTQKKTNIFISFPVMQLLNLFRHESSVANINFKTGLELYQDHGGFSLHQGHGGLAAP